MEDYTHEIAHKLHKLNHLFENAQNDKILWEEMKILSSSAFNLQDEIMELLDKNEKTEKDLIKLQAVFDARELVWDLMNKIAQREMEVKEKTYKKGSAHARENTTKKAKK